MQLNEIDMSSSTINGGFTTTTVSNKQDVEHHLLQRNQCHSKQSLSTPFFKSPPLNQAIDPHHKHNGIDELLHGTFSSDSITDYHLNDTEKEWMSSLKL